MKIKDERSSRHGAARTWSRTVREVRPAPRATALGTAVAVVTSLGLAATPAALGGAAASAAPGPDSTLVVHADEPFRDVTHVATGSLYGLADEGVPSDDLIAPIKPNTFVQMPPGGTQQPTGDTLDVWRTAERNGAGIVVRLSDYYPGWPYRFDFRTAEDREAWAEVVRGVVAAVQDAGVTNVVAYAPWNESDNTWLEENGTYEDFWTYTYRVLREEIGPDVAIQGPSFSDNISDMRLFLENAVATDTVPDVLEWHELTRASKIKGDVETVHGILDDLGIGDLPIDIAEYAAPQDVGLPGRLVGYVAELERYGVDRAELPFWNQSGALGDLLTSRGGDPNGAYWLYTWYADMSGQMVTTTPPSDESPLDGAAAVTEDEDEVSVIAGGGTGPTSVVVDGLDELDLGDSVDVALEVSPAYGRTTPTPAPITISRTTYEVGDDGSITVPVVMNPEYGYHVVVSAASGTSESLAGTYTVRNGGSGLVLDTVDDRAVQSAVEGSPRTWDVVDAGSGLYQVLDPVSGEALGVEGGSTSPGAPVLVEPDDESEDQLWQLVPDGEGSYRFANDGTGLTMGVEDASTQDGAAVVQWTDGAPMSTCRPDGERVEGRLGTALDLCGTSSYVDLPDGLVSGLDGDWSISTWVRPAATDAWARVFDFGSGAGANMFLTLSAGNGPRFAITDGGAGGEQQVTWAGQNLALDEWSQVTITASGSTVTMYVDGEPVASNDDVTISPADLGETTANYVGRSQYSSDPPLDGAVDDFAVYSRALGPQEVADLAAGQPADGDVAQYAFDEADGGGLVVDSSGNGLDGQVVVATGTGTTTTATPEETPDRFWALEPAAGPTEPGAGTDVSLLELLRSDSSGPEAAPGDGRDFDLLRVAVDRVLQARPDSPLAVLADPTAPVTALVPDDDAVRAAVARQVGRPVGPERDAAALLRSRELGVGQLERMLLGHVVPGLTLTSDRALSVDGTSVTTAAGTTLTVSVQGRSVRLLDEGGAVVAVVGPDRVDLNRGQVQVAHVVDRVITTG